MCLLSHSITRALVVRCRRWVGIALRVSRLTERDAFDLAIPIRSRVMYICTSVHHYLQKPWGRDTRSENCK